MPGFEGTVGVPENILSEAERLVYGARESSYGHPRDNMAAIAALVQGYLEARYRGQRIGDLDLQPGDMAAIMILLKLGRYATGGAVRDTIVDLAGYAAVLARTEGVDE